MKDTSNLSQLGACETPALLCETVCGYPGWTTGSDSICDPNSRGLLYGSWRSFPAHQRS